MSSFFKKKRRDCGGDYNRRSACMCRYCSFRRYKSVSKVLRTVFSPFQNGFSYIVNKVTDTTDFIREMNGYKEENARLVGEINELKKQNKRCCKLQRRKRTFKRNA